MTDLKPGLYFISVITGLYSVVAFCGGLPTDAKVSALIALLALAATFFIDHAASQAERDADERLRMAEYRFDVWARRDGEAGL